MTLTKFVIYQLRMEFGKERISLNEYETQEEFDKYCFPHGVFIRFASSEDIKKLDNHII